MRAHALLALLLIACGEEDPETITVIEEVEVEVEVVVDGPPIVASIPALTGWVGTETSLQLAAYVSDDGAPAVDLTYTVDEGAGGFDGARWTHTPEAVGTETVTFTVADAGGQTATGSFEVVVAEPVTPVGDPEPIDGATLVPVEVALAWAGGGGADGFDVYLGTDPMAVAQADPTSPEFMGTVTAAGWDAGRLDPEQTYTWRVDARLGDDAWRGTLWSFETEPANHPPVFWGVQGAAFAGGEAVQLTWQAGSDKETAAADLRYAVYAGSPTVDWSAPLLETSDLSVVLTAADLADIAPGAELAFAVRCVDALGDDDGNTAPITLRLPDASTPVVHVDSAAATGGDGSLAAPYADLQVGLDEVATGGVLLLAEGTAGGGFVLDATGPVQVFGGFPTLSTVDAAATQAELLADRDPATHASTFDGTAIAEDGTFLTLSGDVTLGGLGFVDFSGAAITASDADLRVWDTVFTSTAALRDGTLASGEPTQVMALSLASSAPSEVVSLELLGTTSEWLDDTAMLAGTVSGLTLRNAYFGEHDNRVIDTNREESGTWVHTLAAPDGGAMRIAVDNSSFFRVDSIISNTEVIPQTAGVGGDFDLAVQDIDALALHSSSAMGFSAMGAAGGDVTVDVRDNTLWGVSSDCLTLGIADATGQVAGDVDIRIEDNICRHTNSDAFDIGSISVADGGTTRIVMQGNELGHLESAGHRLNFWGGYDETNLQPDGLIDIEVSGGWCWNCDDGVYLNSGKGTDTRVTIFNNWLVTLYEGVEVSTSANQHEAANVAVWIGFNDAVSSFEGTATRLRPDSQSLFAIRNNASGFNDVDSSEALYISAGGPGGPHIDVRNNVLARGGGEGLDVWGAFPTVVNNTLAFNGRESSSYPGVRGRTSDGYAQVVVENSIVFGNSGADLGPGVSALWSLVGDTTVDQGAHNLGGDPTFAATGDTLDFDSWFRLAPTSPAIDAGNPDPAHDDVDGSPNDMGAFGGPGGSVVGVLGAGAAIPLEVMGIREDVGLQHGGALPGGAGGLTLVLTRSIDSDAGLWVSADGVAVAGSWAFGDRSATFTPAGDWPQGAVIEVGADASVTSVGGVANRFAWSERFATAPSAVTEETTDANDDFASAQVLSDGIWDVTGALSDTDLADHYRFTVAAAGERLTLASFGERSFGKGDLVYEIQDSAGTVVHRGTRSSFYDPATYWTGRSNGDAFLDHVFAAAGDYALVVSDTGGVIGEGEGWAYGFQAWLR